MRHIVLKLLSGFLVVAFTLGASGQDAGKKSSAKTTANSNPSEKSDLKPKDSSPAVTANPATPPSPEEIAIRKTGDSFISAFNRGDAKATAEHYTSDAEYIDETGHLLQGRTAIEKSLEGFFKANPDRKLVLNIESVRFVGTGVAIEDGTSTVTGSRTSNSVTSRYTAVHSKNSGQWLLASVRETAIKPHRQHKSKLRQLDWMLGEWVHEGNDATVVFKCEAIENGNFLLRNYTVKVAGVEAMSGSQRIGWDSHDGKFRSWVFDSDGGHSDGDWHRNGDSWVFKASGVTSDGQPASSTSIYTFVNPHTMTFQMVSHEVAGVELPDSPKVTIVKHPPRPE